MEALSRIHCATDVQRLAAHEPRFARLLTDQSQKVWRALMAAHFQYDIEEEEDAQAQYLRKLDSKVWHPMVRIVLNFARRAQKDAATAARPPPGTPATDLYTITLVPSFCVEPPAYMDLVYVWDPAGAGKYTLCTSMNIVYATSEDMRQWIRQMLVDSDACATVRIVRHEQDVRPDLDLYPEEQDRHFQSMDGVQHDRVTMLEWGRNTGFAWRREYTTVYEPVAMDTDN